MQHNFRVFFFSKQCSISQKLMIIYEIFRVKIYIIYIYLNAYDFLLNRIKAKFILRLNGIRYYRTAWGSIKLYDIKVWLNYTYHIYYTISYHTIHYHFIFHYTIPYDTISYLMIQYNIIFYNIILYDSMQYHTFFFTMSAQIFC